MFLLVLFQAANLQKKDFEGLMINCDIFFEKYLAENLVITIIFLNICDIKMILYKIIFFEMNLIRIVFRFLI